jgi:hypothetical protein
MACCAEGEVELGERRKPSDRQQPLIRSYGCGATVRNRTYAPPSLTTYAFISACRFFIVAIEAQRTSSCSPRKTVDRPGGAPAAGAPAAPYTTSGLTPLSVAAAS